MKRAVYICTMLSIMITTIVINIYINQSIETDFFYDRNRIQIKYNIDTDYDEFYQLLQNYSLNKDITISQYVFTNNDKINIYMTNMMKDSAIHLINGFYPNKDAFIRNEGSSLDGASGEFAYPKTNKLIRIYNMEQARNEGYGYIFYISKNANLNELRIELEKFGEVNIEEAPRINVWKMNNPCYYILAIIIVLIGFMQIIYVNKEKKRWRLYQLWGYSNFKFLIYIIIETLNRLLIMMLLTIVLNICYAFVFNSSLIYYLEYYNLAYCFIILETIVISIIMLLIMIYKINSYQKAVIIKMMMFSIKFISSLIVFLVLIQSSYSYYEVNDNLLKLNYWEKTQNFYRITIRNLGYNYSDLILDNQTNEKLAKFYELLEENKDAFILDTGKFSIMPTVTGEIYYYNMIYGANYPKYHPDYNSLIISKNYFKYNPVVTTDNIDVTKLFVDDPNTLNIIVPEQFKENENEIKNLYLDYFDFKKLYLDNMYNEALNKELSELKKEDLMINIIYAKSGTTYFTYNYMTGFIENNTVKDPTVIIYDGKVNISELGSYATRCMYFKSETIYDAYSDIIEYLYEADAEDYVGATVSVYNELAERVEMQKSDLRQTAVSIIMVIIVSLFMTIILSYIYYQEYKYKLYLYYLFGYSFWRINNSILLLMVLPTIITGALLIILTKIWFLISYVLILFVFEVVIYCILLQKMLKNSALSV